MNAPTMPDRSLSCCVLSFWSTRNSKHVAVFVYALRVGYHECDDSQSNMMVVQEKNEGMMRWGGVRGIRREMR